MIDGHISDAETTVQRTLGTDCSRNGNYDHPLTDTTPSAASLHGCAIHYPFEKKQFFVIPHFSDFIFLLAARTITNSDEEA